MAKETEKVKLQVLVDKDIADKIDELSERVNMSRSTFVATVIEFGLEDQEWIIRMVTSKFMEPVRKLVQKWEKKKNEKNK